MASIMMQRCSANFVKKEIARTNYQLSPVVLAQLQKAANEPGDPALTSDGLLVNHRMSDFESLISDCLDARFSGPKDSQVALMADCLAGDYMSRMIMKTAGTQYTLNNWHKMIANVGAGDSVSGLSLHALVQEIYRPLMPFVWDWCKSLNYSKQQIKKLAKWKRRRDRKVLALAAVTRPEPSSKSDSYSECRMDGSTQSSGRDWIAGEHRNVDGLDVGALTDDGTALRKRKKGDSKPGRVKTSLRRRLLRLQEGLTSDSDNESPSMHPDRKVGGKNPQLPPPYSSSSFSETTQDTSPILACASDVPAPSSLANVSALAMVSGTLLSLLW